YGHEMDEDTSPLVANMGWTIAWEPADRIFIGREVIAAEKAADVPQKLVELVLRERGVLRADQAAVIEGNEQGGGISSGTFSPTLGYSIALAWVPITIGSLCQVEMRGKLVGVEVVKPVFVRQGQSLV